MKKRAALLNAMANPVRLEILTILIKDELNVNTLAEQVGMSQSALSQHLAKLRDQNLVSTRREAQTIYYSSQSPKVLAILDTLNFLFGERKLKNVSPKRS